MTPPPSGELTFLFTDIVGSTALWDQHPQAMGKALAEHDARIRNIVHHADGYVFTTADDSSPLRSPPPHRRSTRRWRSNSRCASRQLDST